MLLILGIVFCGVCMGRAGMTVRAEEETFIMDARVLPSDQSVYEIQVTVENRGKDWEGTVRLRMTEGPYEVLNDCAYDTELALPQGSTKQFVVRVPKDTLDRTDGVAQVTLLDKKADMVAQKEFGRLLQAEVDSLMMGILSDEYRSLSYLDMGGDEFYYNGKGHPIKLEEMDQDKLSESLDALNYLVIDSYNTGVLSEQTLENIRQWMDDGGMLIIGTGSGAEEVLAGFDDLVQCARVYDPGAGPNVFSDQVDVSKLPMAELMDASGKFEEGYDVFGLICSRGNGAVEILPYSLSEVAQMNAAGDYEQQKSFVESVLWQVNDYARNYGSGQYTYNYDSDSKYLLEEMIEYLGNGSSRLRFGGLKLIVILYVIFVGPVLYLILRFAKKRDLYWIAVPVTTLVGIFLVYFAGRGFEVVSTNVYSVTVENLDDGNARTYLHCYDAGHKEWKLRLAEGYEYVGPLEGNRYRDSDENYYYHIRKEGDRLFFGMNPSMGFEDGYFQAGVVRESEEGSIHSDVQMNSIQGIHGTVANGTKQDFKYFAVSTGEHLFVYKDLPAGAEVKLEDLEVVYNNQGGYYTGVDRYYYDFMRSVQNGEMEKDVDILSALGMGIFSAYYVENPNATMIVGVTEDWDKAVDDHCSEVSYGCLYAVQ